MSRIERVCRAQEGAIFVQTGIALFVLMSFSVFVLDYGAMWIARAEAQNAADAGALAGAVARGFDDVDDPPHWTGPVVQMAQSVASANLIWQQPGTPVATFACPAGVTAHCVRVDVTRTIPTFFGPILGVSSQGVRATATAVAASGNATPCLRPLAFADNWDEDRNPNDQFNHYDTSGSPYPASDRDEYTPPSSTYAGRTTVTSNFGERIVWDISDDALDRGTPITRQLVVPLDLPGGETFLENMTGCLGEPLALNQYLNVIPSIHPGDVRDALAAVFAQDSGADYDYGNSRVTNSCAPNCASGTVSPRLMAVALYDPQRFQLGRTMVPPNWTHPSVGCPTNQPCIRVTNIVGFFMHRIGSGGGFGPHGHILRYPGVTISTAPTFVNEGSWLVTTHLIR